MPEDSNDTQKQTEDRKVSMPDFIELWKQLYFQTENAMAHTTKEFIGSKSFIQMLDQIREQYLSAHQVAKQNTDTYLSSNPLPSKKDIARLAELIIGLEDKVDDFDLQFADNVRVIANSLVKLVDYQETVKLEIAALRQENAMILKKLDANAKKLNAIVRTCDSMKDPTIGEKAKVKKTK